MTFAIAICFIATSIVYSISGFIQMAYPTLTIRAYRRVLLDYTVVTSFAFGILLEIFEANEGNIYKVFVLVGGAIILFVLSFYIPTFRRKSIIVPGIWSFLVLVLVYIFQ